MDQEENGRFTPLHSLAHVHHEEYVFAVTKQRKRHIYERNRVCERLKH